MIIEEIGQLPGNFPKLYNPMKYVSSSVEDFGIPIRHQKLVGIRQITILKSLLNKVNARLDRIEKMLKIQ